jgi:hypothetical protein
MRTPITLAVCALLLPLAAPAVAQDDGSFTGQFQVGVRSVDVSGRHEKFAEDINLDDGPRLFNLQLDYVPADALRTAVDKVELYINNMGGDPFESMGLSIEKYGRWDFDWNRRKSTYFYEDIILPHELAGDPTLGLAFAGDFHHFDFDRVQDTLDFDFKLSDRASLNFGMQRFTKQGESTTTIDLQRDEFEFDKPIDESLNDYSVGFSYAWDKVTLVLEEKIADYENAYEFFLPGRSLGEDPFDGGTLDFFFLTQPYDYTSNDHILRLTARPNDRLIVKAMVDLQTLDLDVEADEHQAGTTFAGVPFESDLQGSGGIERDLELFDVDVTYRVNEKLAVVGGVKQYSLDQQADFTFGGALNASDWQIDTTSIQLGVEYSVSPQVLVSAGILEESRDVDFTWSDPAEAVSEDEKTDQTGYYATLAWRPNRFCRVEVSFEDSSYDDPFTLASPTDRQRVRVRGRYGNENGFNVTGSYAMNDVENSNSGWDSTYDQADLRLGYRRDDLNVSFGYNLVDMDRSIDQIVSTPPGFGAAPPFLVAIDYQAEATFVDGRVRYEANEDWTLGADLRMYDNDGSFGLKRDDYRAWVEMDFGTNYLLHLGYRTVDYDEERFNFDDYDADIAEISVGYRW